MHRYRGQKALYEAIRRSQERMKRTSVEPFHPESETTSPPIESPKPEKSPSTPTQARRSRWQRPRPIQINEGRLEFALPFPMVFVVVLAFFLCILGIFRYGWHVGRVSSNQTQQPQTMINRSENQLIPTGERLISPNTESQNDLYSTTPTVPLADNSGDMETTGPGNAIAILTWHDRTKLMPVMEFFNNNDIETEIITRGIRYYLVSKKRFTKDPRNPGTKGYQYKQRIIELGKQYATQPGTIFAPQSFEGAFGILIKD